MSLRMSSIFLPATMSPCCFMYSLIPLSILNPGIGELPAIGHDHADLDCLLGVHRLQPSDSCRGKAERGRKEGQSHRILLFVAIRSEFCALAQSCRLRSCLARLVRPRKRDRIDTPRPLKEPERGVARKLTG